MSASGGESGSALTSGVKLKDDKKVVSTTIKGRLSSGSPLTIDDTSWRGWTNRVGLVGISIQTSYGIGNVSVY